MKLTDNKITDMMMQWFSTITDDQITNIYDDANIATEFHSSSEWEINDFCCLSASEAVDVLSDYWIDMFGARVKKLNNYTGCWLRVFCMKNNDCFRCEVVSNPEDTEVLGWTVICD